MTRRTNRVAVMAILAAFLLSLGSARAAAPFNPIQTVSTLFPYYSYGSTLSFDVRQNDQELTIKQYDIGIPAGWHIAFATPDPSTQLTCNGLTSANIATSAERVGTAVITVINDDTRGFTGPLTYRGFLYYLSYDSVTDTATLCGRVTTTSTRIPTANREIMYEAKLRHNLDGSGNLQWNYSAVTGAAPGTRSIFDNSYYTSKRTSITWSSQQLYAFSDGNFNTAPDGTKAGVKFTWNPDAIANYAFNGTYTQCLTGESSFCTATPTSATRTWTLAITDYPVGYHPGPKLTAPAFWSVQTSPAPTQFKWTQPSTVASDKIKGYALTVSGDIAPTTQKKSVYLITDASNPSVENPNPCGAAGTDATCTYNFDWTSLLTDGGQPMNPDAVFSANLVAIYQDGHRSDGRCDEGATIPEKVAGKASPCIDLSSPAYDSYRGTGISSTQFLHRNRAWPLRYQKKIASSTGQDSPNAMSFVYVLLIDFDTHEFQYVQWKPVGITWSGSGQTINGTNAGGGEIAFSVLSGPYHWSVDAVVNPSDARGVFLLASSTNDLQDQDLFTGQPVPAGSAQMSKV